MANAILPILITAVYYMLVPVLFSVFRKKPITKDGYKGCTFGFTVCLYLVLLIIAAETGFVGAPSLTAPVIWGIVAYNVGVRILNSRIKLCEKNTSRANSPIPSKNNIIKQAKVNSKAAGGNFGYIAQNVATIYYCIKEHTDLGPTLSQPQLVYASLCIDSAAYLSQGSFLLEDLSNIVCRSSTGCIGMDYMYPKRCCNPLSLDKDEFDLLSCATAALEIEIFLADNNINYHAVIDAVYARYDEIASMIRRTVAQGESSPLFSSIIPTVLALCSDPSFINDVKSASVEYKES